MPARSSAARCGASAPRCGLPISAASPRSPTRIRGWRSSRCSTRCSRRWRRRCARAAARDAATCRRALDAAVEAKAALDRLAAARAAAAKPAAAVDLALHLGEVLYGNVGAVDRLDFTVIGPAVNEVSRIEALCDRLGRNLLVSAEFAAALGPGSGLVPLGRHALRGVREARAIYGVEPA